MSKTNKFLAVCAAFIGLGIILYFTGFFLGESVIGIGINRDGFQVYTWNQTKMKETDILETIDSELDAFQSIDMSASYANVEIKESDRFKISYKTAANHSLSYEIKDGTLYVDQANNTASSFNYMFIGFSGIQSSNIRENESITVYIPENTELSKVSISNDCGNTNLSALNASSVSLYMDYGDISLTDVSAPVIALNINTGDLKMDNITADTLTVTTDYGDAALSAIDASSIITKVNTGSLNIKDIASGIFETVIDYGDLQLSSIDTDSLSVKINTGDLTMADITANTFIADIEYGENNAERITISGNTDITMGSGSLYMKDAAFHTLTADNEYGNVSLRFSSPAADYSYDLFTEYGTIKIEEQDMGAKYKPLSSPDLQKNIKVSCGSGNIDISGL